MRAAKLSKKAARTGFDWPNAPSIINKLREETQELEAAVARGNKDEIKGEIGDLLFTIVNIARFLDMDPEESLREMLKRFAYRFNKIEESARRSGRDIHDMTLEEMDQVWNQAKQG